MVKISCKLPLDRNVYETKIFLQLSSMQCNYGIVKKKKKKVQILLPNGLRNTVEFGAIFEYYL